MKYLLSVLLFCACFSVASKEAQVVPVGKGVYMLTRKNATIFGSSDGIIAKLMTQANSFCEAKHLGQAELIDSAGSEAIPGSGKPLGQGATFGQGSIGTIYFRCAGDKAESAPAVATNDYSARVSAIKDRVVSGDLTSIKSTVIATPIVGFSELPKTDADLLERNQMWWIETNGKYFLYMTNVTSGNVGAFELTLTDGYCDKPTKPEHVFVVQLEQPILAGGQAVTSFWRPNHDPSLKVSGCGVITKAWTSKQ